MLINQAFYHSTIRKLVVGMGTLINDIHLVQKDSVGNQVKDTKVPVAYAPRQGYWAKLREAPGDEIVQKTLPRISFNFEGLEYDPERQLNPLNPTSAAASGLGVDYAKRMFQRVPYNFNFNVSVFVKNVEDGLQIIEQIIPFFTPQFNLVIKEIPEMGIVSDIPVIIGGVSQEDNYSEGFNENRLISWSFDFIAKGHIYQPITDSRVIKKAFSNISVEPSMTTQLEQIGIVVNPLTAGIGDPHTVVTSITAV